MPADASAIDAAIIARLTDAQLQALMPAGPFWDVAGKAHTAMTIVSLSEDATAFAQFGGRDGARTVYLAKAVELNTSSTKVAQAAARIHALLQWENDEAGNPTPPPLTIVGYDLLALRRVERVRYTEVDSANPDQRWQHQGGLYEVITAPTAP